MPLPVVRAGVRAPPKDNGPRPCRKGTFLRGDVTISTRIVALVQCVFNYQSNLAKAELSEV